MNPWLAAVLAFIPALLVPVVASAWDRAGGRLVAVQLASSMAVQMLVMMTFAFDQQSFVDLALSLGLLSLPGTLVLALFIERWA